MFFDYYVYVYLQLVFMSPARMIARTDAMEQWAKQFRPPTICKP